MTIIESLLGLRAKLDDPIRHDVAAGQIAFAQLAERAIARHLIWWINRR